MTNTRRRALLGALAVATPVVTPGCSTTRWFDAIPDAGSAAAYRPPLYRLVAPASAPGAGWLLGTVHAPRPELLPLPGMIRDRLAAADALAVELDVTRRAAELHQAFTARAVLPADQTLDQWLSPAAVSALRQRFSLGDTRWQALRRLRPWAFTRALHGTDRRRSAVRAISLEEHLLTMARRAQKPVIELEQPDVQIDALAGGSVQWQARLLEARATDPRFWQSDLNRLVGAWRRGDTRQLLALKQRAFGTDPLHAPLHERMFTLRDALMAKRIAHELTQPRTLFAAVGAFHLIGQHSLRDQLHRFGVRVDRVY